MRIIHTADLHLDSKMKTNLNGLKSKERKKELLNSFVRLVDFANKNKVRVILIAGDMFDKSIVSTKTKGFIYDIIKRNLNIDFLYLSGNHDEESFISSLENLPNLKTFNNEWVSYKYDDVVISGIVSTKSNKHIYDLLYLNEQCFNIVTLHGQLGLYKDDDINLNKLSNKHIDYLALGHIHEYSLNKLDERGVYCYSGCLEGRGFDEIGVKGFSLIDTSTKSYEFIPFSKRIIYDEKIDISLISEWNEIYAQVEKAIKHVRKEDMLKLRLVGQYDMSLIKQIDYLNEKLNEEFYFAKVYDESKLRFDSSKYEKEISLKGEFIRTVLNSSFDDETKQKIIELGISSLRKEGK